MPDNIATQVAQYLEALQRENSSPHTIRNYKADLDQFVAYFTLPDCDPPEIGAIDSLGLREWLGFLYRQKLSSVTLRRKLAAVRSFYRHLQREHVIETNLAKLIRTPKTPKTITAVMSAEHANVLIDGVGDANAGQPHPARDAALFELLYGCGLRVSELVGLNMEDLDFADRWILVRGKGRKERQVPFGSKARAALETYFAVRRPALEEHAVFLNHRGMRLSDRGARKIVKFYSTLLLGDSSLHPHSFRHAYATHLLADGADLRCIQELLGHARLSTTQKYTQVALADLMAVYDKAHPKS